MDIICCRRCRTYVNPYVTFTDGGRKWQCDVCVLLNEAAPVVKDLGEMYRQADSGAIISLLSKLATEKSLSFKLEEARNSIQLIVKALIEYRNLYAVQQHLGSRMIYPESLKFLPLYGLTLCKSTPLCGGYADAQLDERCAAG